MKCKTDASELLNMYDEQNTTIVGKERLVHLKKMKMVIYSFQTCSVLEYKMVLNNVGIQTTLDPIDFYCTDTKNTKKHFRISSFVSYRFETT